MNNKIKNALSNVNIPNRYIKKAINDIECIVYNYSSYPSYYSDNTLAGNSYIILINLYCIDNLENKKKSILNAMRNNGFSGGRVETTNIEKESDGNVIYNTAITFNGFLRTNN